jgi:translation initiation factor 5B
MSKTDEKSQYVHNDEVKAALGVKIFAPGLDEAIAGARVFVAEDEDEESYFKDICMDDLATLERFTVGAKGKGVYVQADTLGALEALLTFLQSNKVPIFDFGIGPLHAKSIRSQVLMAERAPEYACVLAFNVSIEQDAKVLAAKEGLKIFDGMSPRFVPYGYDGVLMDSSRHLPLV